MPRLVGIGTLLDAAKQAGLDLSPWRDLAFARLQAGAASAAIGATTAATVLHWQQRAVHVSALPLVPEKREWLHGTDAMRGAVTLFVAPGGRGKSSWLIVFALACASSRSLLDTHIFGGSLRVLIISAEDPTAEVARRIRAGMQYYGLNDADLPALHIIGADKWGLSLLRSIGNTPVPDEQGWGALNTELERINPDIIVLDPLMSFMGGVDGNNNSAAAIFMGKLVKLAADRHMAVVVAHHAAKGRDPTSAESAMGAASFVNFARIVLTIEPLSEKDAVRVGLPPWEVKSIFRVLGVKQNFSRPTADDRWFRQVTVQLNNARPPVYPTGDKVAVVEPFQPGASGPAYGPGVIAAALEALDGANPPLSPSKRATGRYAADAIAIAIAPHRGGKASDVWAEAILGHIIRSGLASVQRVKIARLGGRADERNGLVLTPQGKAAMQEPGSTGAATTAPQSPQSSRGNDAGRQDGGSLRGPRNVPRGCGGNAGGEIAGSGMPIANSDSSKRPAIPRPCPLPPLDFLRREQPIEPVSGTPSHQPPVNSSTTGGTQISTATSIDINKTPGR